MAVPRWAYFLTAIMFSINLLFIGFGLININSSPLSSEGMGTLGTPISEYSGEKELTPKTSLESESRMGGEEGGEMQFGVSDIVNIVINMVTLILNLLFGYTVIFWMLNMPPILVYLFSTIIGFAMAMVVVDILISAVTAVRRLI